MEENKRHIDDFLRDELGNYTETPPPAVWDDLEKRLDARTDHKGFDFRKWWWFIPALLFVAGGTFLEPVLRPPSALFVHVCADRHAKLVGIWPPGHATLSFAWMSVGQLDSRRPPPAIRVCKARHAA